jgi:hypothetical protein
MGNMAMSLERDPQMESLLEGRKKQLGISMDFDSGMRLGGNSPSATALAEARTWASECSRRLLRPRNGGLDPRIGAGRFHRDPLLLPGVEP